MKKQLAIAIVAILLTTVLIASPVMAFALWDGNSVQYSSQWGYNSIANTSVTASNQSIDIGEYSSRLKYYRAPVPVRTSNWPPIIKDSGIHVLKGVVIRGNTAYSADEIYWTDSADEIYWANDIKNPPLIIPGVIFSMCSNEASAWVRVDGTVTLMKIDRNDFMLNGTITLLP
jgi:hypothetical protein